MPLKSNFVSVCLCRCYWQWCIYGPDIYLKISAIRVTANQSDLVNQLLLYLSNWSQIWCALIGLNVINNDALKVQKCFSELAQFASPYHHQSLLGQRTPLSWMCTLTNRTWLTNFCCVRSIQTKLCKPLFLVMLFTTTHLKSRNVSHNLRNSQVLIIISHCLVNVPLSPGCAP